MYFSTKALYTLILTVIQEPHTVQNRVPYPVIQDTHTLRPHCHHLPIREAGFPMRLGVGPAALSAPVPATGGERAPNDRHPNEHIDEDLTDAEAQTYREADARGAQPNEAARLGRLAPASSNGRPYYGGHGRKNRAHAGEETPDHAHEETPDQQDRGSRPRGPRR